MFHQQKMRQLRVLIKEHIPRVSSSENNISNLIYN